MTTHVPVALGGSTRGLSIVQQRAEMKALERLDARGCLSDAARHRLRMLRERERQRGIKGKMRLRGAAYFSLKGLGELMLLHRTSLKRALTDAESERMGVLLKREQNDPAPRLERMRVFREAIGFLESLEMAEHGASAEGSATGEPVEMIRGADGGWSSEARAA